MIRKGPLAPIDCPQCPVGQVPHENAITNKLTQKWLKLWERVDAGVRVVSVTQQFDLSGPIGKTVAGFLSGIAEIDVAHIRERQAAGIAEAKSRGVYRGRKSGAIKADPARARELKAKGMKPAEIMKALGIGSQITRHKYLRGT